MVNKKDDVSVLLGHRLLCVWGLNPTYLVQAAAPGAERQTAVEKVFAASASSRKLGGRSTAAPAAKCSEQYIWIRSMPKCGLRMISQAARHTPRPPPIAPQGISYTDQPRPGLCVGLSFFKGMAQQITKKQYYISRLLYLNATCTLIVCSFYSQVLRKPAPLARNVAVTSLKNKFAG